MRIRLAAGVLAAASMFTVFGGAAAAAADTAAPAAPAAPQGKALPGTDLIAGVPVVGGAAQSLPLGSVMKSIPGGGIPSGLPAGL
jgi:hypothetical protein